MSRRRGVGSGRFSGYNSPMFAGRLAVCATLVGLVLLAGPTAPAQFGDRQDSLPDPIPPPLPPKKPPKGMKKVAPLTEESNLPWDLPADLLISVRNKTTVYQDYARKFTCDEEARSADYDSNAQVAKERLRRYGYLLLQDPAGENLREYRQEYKNGRLKGEVVDEEPFPPAYAWVYLFSHVKEPYFDFRLIETRFDGFDVVHEIQFRGSLPFTDGKDIRQWEGTVLIDAFRFTPLEIVAEPLGQQERIEALYRRWAKSFNVLGFRTGKAPLGYRARIQFGYVRDTLSFPTQLRYDTHRAVSPVEVIAISASTRTYSGYLFTGVKTGTEEVGGVRP